MDGLADELADEGGSEKLAELNGPLAFLCHVCSGKLQSIARLEQKLRDLRAEMNSQLQVVLCSNAEKEAPQSAGHKRCREDASRMVASNKAPRLDPQMAVQDKLQSAAHTALEQLTGPQQAITAEESSQSPPVILEQPTPCHFNPLFLPVLNRSSIQQANSKDLHSKSLRPLRYSC